ncbi:MAG: hypothetical protein ACPHX8_07965 [Candidatus Poseidoniaceae archaeon]
MEVPMGLFIESIASDGLVYCYDPIQYGDEVQSTAHRALLNVLKSQRFDSIPLVMDNGNVERIARRRLHDGDLEQHVFILGLEECATAKPGTTILEAMFKILSNEHHILFVLDEKSKQPVRVLSMSMLNCNEVRDYLRLKIASLHHSKWHWNEEYLGEPASSYLHLADEIFNQLKRLAKLVDDKKELQSDEVVSTQIVNILSLLQPVKDFDGTMPKEKFSLSIPKRKIIPRTVEQFMTYPAASLHDDDDEVLWMAYKLFAVANKWDNLLLKDASNKPYKLITGCDKSTILTSNIERIKPSASVPQIISKLKKNDFQPLFSEKSGDKWPGILTPEDVFLNEHLIMDIIVKMSSIEKKCRAYLIQKNELYVPFPQRDDMLTVFANWKDVINMMRKYKSKDIKKKVFDKLDELRHFRNKVIHEFLALVNSCETELPRWMNLLFTEGYDNLTSVETSFQNTMPDEDAYHALKGLDELLTSRGKKGIKFIKSGLTEVEITSNKSLILKFQSNTYEKYKQAIAEISKEDLQSWTKCDDVSLVSIS